MILSLFFKNPSENFAFDQTCPFDDENLFVGLEACCELVKNAVASSVAFGMPCSNEIDL